MAGGVRLTCQTMFYYFFFFPLGVDVRRTARPWATWALVATNIAAYIVTHHVASDGSWILELAVIPARLEPWTLLTACFLHAGVVHLAGNLLYLVLFGGSLEDRLGHRRFLVTYLAAGAASMWLQAVVVRWAMPADAYYPVIGASGAVAGLLGVFLVRLPYARVRVASLVLFLLHGVNRADVRSIPGAIAIVAWLLIELVYGLATAGSGPAVAHWAHLGGGLFGVIGAVAMGCHRDARIEHRWARGQRYFASGYWYAAAGEFEAYLASRPDDAEGHCQLARTLVAAGARRQAIAGFSRALERHLASGRERDAARTYLEMDRLLPGVVLAPQWHFLLARALLHQGEYEAARTALLDVARAFPDHEQAELARLVALEVGERLQGATAETARLWRDLDPRRLPPRWRERAYARCRRRRVA